MHDHCFSNLFSLYIFFKCLFSSVSWNYSPCFLTQFTDPTEPFSFLFFHLIALNVTFVTRGNNTQSFCYFNCAFPFLSIWSFPVSSRKSFVLCTIPFYLTRLFHFVFPSRPTSSFIRSSPIPCSALSASRWICWFLCPVPFLFAARPDAYHVSFRSFPRLVPSCPAPRVPFRVSPCLVPSRSTCLFLCPVRSGPFPRLVSPSSVFRCASVSCLAPFHVPSSLIPSHSVPLDLFIFMFTSVWFRVLSIIVQRPSSPCSLHCKHLWCFIIP
jgi:hypothetical protein